MVLILHKIFENANVIQKQNIKLTNTKFKLKMDVKGW